MSAPSGVEAPKGACPTDQQAPGAPSESKGNQPAPQVLSPSSGTDTCKVPVPTHPLAAGGLEASSDTTGKTTESSPGTKCGEQKSPSEPQSEKGGRSNAYQCHRGVEAPAPTGQPRRDPSHGAWRRGTPGKDGP
ncbi:hypothetical protein MTO96_051947, partial [Rhipicephalus appendiculatus]